MGFICFRPAPARAGFIAAINIDTSFPYLFRFFIGVLNAILQLCDK